MGKPVHEKPRVELDSVWLSGVAVAVENWFATAARDLPWRVAGGETFGAERDPYRTLVSEAMLQQTQVSRVVERFELFIERFPSVESLAQAREEDVLAAWSGLGYYRRARMLHAAARVIAEKHNGVVPDTALELATLPGVGRYTAGAIASLAFGERTPAVDGNVMRVLQRIGGHPGAGDDRKVIDWAWKMAEDVIEKSSSPGTLNEGLIELGATVCVARSPECERCPLRSLCHALASGLVDEIPSAKARAKRRAMFATSVVLIDSNGRVLIEQRDISGLWGGLWQVPTHECDVGAADIEKKDIARAVLARVGLGEEAAHEAEYVGGFGHTLTHREVRFEVWRASLSGAGPEIQGMRWASQDDLARIGLSNAQKRVIAMVMSTDTPVFSLL